MKILLLVLLLPITTNNTQALELHLEKGQATTLAAEPGEFASADYSAIVVRHRHLEVIGGGWSGESRDKQFNLLNTPNNANFAGFGFYIKSDKKYFAEAGLGIVKLFNADTKRLDGKNQYMITLGVGAKFEDLYAIVRFRHFSNNDEEGENLGLDIALISLGVEF